MKLLFTLALTAVSATRVRRSDDTAPAIINNIIDAWNEMVIVPNAHNHGCQCLNIMSDDRYPGAPVDDLDRTCLAWFNAIKCQRFEGGICGAMSNSDLPSYTNYANCDDNIMIEADACAAALCKINKEFADRINNQSGISVNVLADPLITCVRANDAPKFNSCCFTDLFSSMRYDSAENSCVHGAIVASQVHGPITVSDARFTVLTSDHSEGRRTGHYGGLPPRYAIDGDTRTMAHGGNTRNVFFVTVPSKAVDLVKIYARGNCCYGRYEYMTVELVSGDGSLSACTPDGSFTSAYVQTASGNMEALSWTCDGSVADKIRINNPDWIQIMEMEVLGNN